MNAKRRGLLSAFVLSCTLLAAHSARAIVIKASNYAVGTNLTDAFPGLILQYATYNGSGPGFTTSPLIIGSDTEFLGDGVPRFNTFGETYSAQGPNPGQYFATSDTDGQGWNAIYVGFTVPAQGAAALGFEEEPMPAAMAAYGAYGQQTDLEINNGGPFRSPSCIPWGTPGAGPPLCLSWPQVSVTSPTPISYVLFGGTDDLTYFTELDIPGIRVPEPSSLALFGCGLLAMGIVILRRRAQFTPKLPMVG